MSKPKTKPSGAAPASSSVSAPSVSAPAPHTKPARAATRQKTAALVATARTAGTAAQQRAEELLEEIGRRKQRIAEEFYDIGEALRDLQKKKLHAALGYASFAALLEARQVMSLSQAHKLIRIVTTLPRAKALAVGSEKASILSGYAEATPEPDTPEWLLDEGKLPDGKPIAEASTRELAEAAKKARSKSAKKPVSPEETAARSGAKVVQAALRKRGAKLATAEVVRRSGKWWLRVEIPAESAELLRG